MARCAWKLDYDCGEVGTHGSCLRNGAWTVVSLGDEGTGPTTTPFCFAHATESARRSQENQS